MLLLLLLSINYEYFQEDKAVKNGDDSGDAPPVKRGRGRPKGNKKPPAKSNGSKIFLNLLKQYITGLSKTNAHNIIVFYILQFF